MCKMKKKTLGRTKLYENNNIRKITVTIDKNKRRKK